MKAKRPSRQHVILIFSVLGLIAFAAYFYVFINPLQVIAVLSQINPSYYAGAFVVYSLYVLFSSLVWQRLLGNLSVRISARKALLFTWAGLFFEATVPQLGWSGEVSKTYLLSKDSKIDAGKIGASVVGQKIFVMTMSVVALAVGLSSVLVSNELPLLVTFLIALVLSLSILTLTIVCIVSLRPTVTRALLDLGIRVMLLFRKRWNPRNFRLKAEEWIGRFHVSIGQIKANHQGLIQPIIFSIVGFVFEISVVFLSFLALGYHVPIDKVLIVFTLTGTVQTVGLTFFGFPEVIMSTSFAALGILPVSLGFSVTLLARIVNLWFRLIVSYAALQWAGLGILRNSKSDIT